MTTAARTTQQQLEQAEADALAASRAADAARREHARAIEAADAERDRLGRVAAQRRLDAYDHTSLASAAIAARSAFRTALASDAVIAAYIDWRTAELWTTRRAEMANYDRHALGLPEHETPAMPFAVPSFADTLTGIVGQHIVDGLAQLEQDMQDQQQQEVYGELPLTMEQHIAREQHDEERRRRDRARPSTPPGSVDVSNMTDQQRAAAGVPIGRHKDRQ